MTNFKEILKILYENGVEFILIGGLAAIAHGCTTSTSDLDIVYKKNPENLKRLVKALKPLQVKLRGAPADLPFIFDEKSFQNILQFTLQTKLGALDLLAEIPGFKNYNEILASSEKLNLFGLEIFILSIDGLIKNKKATARPKDLLHLPELEELKKLDK